MSLLGELLILDLDLDPLHHVPSELNMRRLEFVEYFDVFRVEGVEFSLPSDEHNLGDETTLLSFPVCHGEAVLVFRS